MTERENRAAVKKSVSNALPTSAANSKGGRPSLYSDDLADLILDRLEAGESLTDVCAEPGMPSMRTVLKWAAEDGKFMQEYARAREAQAERMDDSIQKEAEATTPENAHAQRVKIDALKWRAAKLAPKRYGEKVQHTGGDGESPIRSNITITFRKAGEAPPQDMIEGEFREGTGTDSAALE